MYASFIAERRAGLLMYLPVSKTSESQIVRRDWFCPNAHHYCPQWLCQPLGKSCAVGPEFLTTLYLNYERADNFQQNKLQDMTVIFQCTQALCNVGPLPENYWNSVRVAM